MGFRDVSVIEVREVRPARRISFLISHVIRQLGLQPALQTCLDRRGQEPTLASQPD